MNTRARTRPMMPGHAPPGALSEILPDRWGFAYLAFLAYTFAMITGRSPIGTPAAVLGVVLLLAEGRKLAFPTWFKLMVGFLVWGCIGYLASPYSDMVQLGILEFLKFVVVVGLGINVIRTRRQANFFLLFALAAYLMYPIRGTYLRYFLYNDTAFGRAIGIGIYENSNDLAALTLLQVSVAVAIYVGAKSKLVRLGALGAAASMALIIVLTQSRGVYLGTALFVGLLISTQRRKARAIFGLVVAGVVIMSFAPSSTFERFTALTSLIGGGNVAQLDEEGSAEGRMAIYRLALQMSRDSPVTGIGLDAYPQAHRDYTRNSSGIFEVSRGTLDTHSTYLNVLAETGVPGLLIYMAMLWVALKSILQVRKRVQKTDPDLYEQLGVLLAGYLGFLLAAVVGTYTSLALTYVHLGAIWAYAHVASRSLPGRVLQGAPRRRRRAPAPRPTQYRPGMLPWGPPSDKTAPEG